MGCVRYPRFPGAKAGDFAHVFGFCCFSVVGVEVGYLVFGVDKFFLRVPGVFEVIAVCPFNEVLDFFCSVGVSRGEDGVDVSEGWRFGFVWVFGVVGGNFFFGVLEVIWGLPGVGAVWVSRPFD